MVGSRRNTTSEPCLNLGLCKPIEGDGHQNGDYELCCTVEGSLDILSGISIPYGFLTVIFEITIDDA